MPSRKLSARPWSRIRLRVLVRDRWRCHWCGRKATTVDHVVPRALGGSDDPRNLVASCASCNSRRGAELVAKLGKRHGSAPRAGRRVWPGALGR